MPHVYVATVNGYLEYAFEEAVDAILLMTLSKRCLGQVKGYPEYLDTSDDANLCTRVEYKEVVGAPDGTDADDSDTDL